MAALFQHRIWHYVLLIGAGTGLFLVNLGQPSLWDRDEGSNATCALEMLESGDFVVPQFNGDLRPDKPVLLYWLQTLAFTLFGVNEFAARLPSALASLVSLLLCYEIGRSLFGKTTGLLAALITGSTPLMCGTARFANPDALLDMFVIATMFCFWRSQGKGARWFAAMGVISGLAVLAKGPIGLLPCAATLLYSYWSRQWHAYFRPAMVFYLLTLAIIALPWYILVGIETRGRFLAGFLFEHNVMRFLSPMERHDGSMVFYYPIVVVVSTVPWSIFSGFLVWAGWLSIRDRRVDAVFDRTSPSPNRARKFLLSWVAVFFLFFSFSATKLPNYILPALVPLALLTADILVRWTRGELQPPEWLAYAALACLMLTGVGTMLALLILSGALPIVRGHTYPGLENLAIVGIVPLIGGAAGWRLLRRRQRAGMVWTVTLANLAFAIPIGIWGTAHLDSFKPPRLLAERYQAQRTDRPVEIVCYNVEHLSSLNFYCRRDVTHLGKLEAVLPYLGYPSRVAVYLVIPAHDWEELKERLIRRKKPIPPHRELGHHYDMYHNDEVLVIGNP